MNCDYCKKTIKKTESQYESKQIGLEGSYHWGCFTKLVKEVNRQGKQMLENNLLDAGIYQNPDKAVPGERI
ncbi:MAG: hypothetical protein ISR91_01600 [Candidatus Delongbacteria bacterium]|nr:hypothetical protein [bacterium]MBL7032815.1 hypothetical protein [Candidatus Delongbacteria bacterium]